MTVKAGEVGQGGVSPQLNEAEVRKCIPSSRVTFQEVLLIRICIVNVRTNGSWEISKGKLLPPH